MYNKEFLLKSLLLLLLFVVSFTPLVYSKTWTVLEEEMKERLQDNPQDLLLNFQLGVAYAKTGKIEKAFESFNQMKEKEDTIKPEEVPAIYQQRLEDGGDPLIHLSYLAFAYHVLNDYQQSRAAFEELLVLEPKNIWNYNYLGLVYRDLKMLPEAEQVLLDSLSLESNSYTRFILGLVYYDQGRYVRALIEFGRARDVAKTIFDMR